MLQENKELEAEINSLKQTINKNKNKKARIFKITPDVLKDCTANVKEAYDKEIYIGNKILNGLKQERKLLNYQYHKYKNDLDTIRVNMPYIG